jgi:hypothetical protein
MSTIRPTWLVQRIKVVAVCRAAFHQHTRTDIRGCNDNVVAQNQEVGMSPSRLHTGSVVARQERANKQTELERQLRRRDRRNARLTLLAISCIAFAVAFYLYQVNQRLREQHKLSRARFDRAQRDLQLPTPTHDALALHDFAIALRYNPGNVEAAKKACELLTQNVWCPPMTAPLHYPGSAILSATFSPGGRVFAVSGDGKLLRCDQDSSKG